MKDLLKAVEVLKKKDIDVLVIMRGGGSLESFLAFNNETLIRAVADFPIPVLTGIGHDKDIPLISMVSDRNVSTPTAVANLLNSSWDEALSSVRLSEEKIMSQFQSGLKDTQFVVENSQISIERKFVSLFETFKDAEKTMVGAVIRIESQISKISEKIKTQAKELVRGFENVENKTKEFILQASKTIELSNPKNQLKRGYSIVKSKGKVIRRVDDVKRGDELDIMVSDGIIESKAI